MERSSFPGFTAQQLKWIACAFMLCDHIGALLLPQHFFLRGLGRLAFPIFAFMTANGYLHTQNVCRYLLRLAVFALLYQPVYSFCMGPGHINIFVTLFFGLAAIWLFERLRELIDGRILPYLPVLLIFVLAEGLHIEYGGYGIGLIFTAYLFYQQPKALCLSWLLLAGFYLYTHWPLWVQAWSLLSLPLLLCYNQQRGRGSKWLFYGFYCLHIPILYAIGRFLL